MLKVFISDPVNQVQYDDPESVDVIIIWPPTGGQDSDLENEDDKILKTTGLLEKIAGVIGVFNININEIERMNFDGDNSDMEPPTAKKLKQNAKKSKINLKWQK